jgi:hypothetical protein
MQGEALKGTDHQPPGDRGRLGPYKSPDTAALSAHEDPNVI